jgi:hypothetical protein
MTLTDELLAAVEADEKVCGLCQLLSVEDTALDGREKSALRQALSSKIGYRTIYKILAKNGHPVSQGQIMSHRSERHGV